MTLLEIQHDPVEGEFYITDGSAKACIKYVISTRNGIQQCDFVSTFVPHQWRGKGLAERLVRAAIAWGKEKNYELHASCWYVAKFLRRP